jgi:hypothetical protein
MGFVELDDIYGLGDDADEHMEDLHPKKILKDVSLSGAVLMMTMS